VTEPRTLPEAEVGARSHSWWGLVMGLVVIGVAVATLISSYLYLLVESDFWPPEGVGRPSLGFPLLATVALVLSLVPLRRAWPGTDPDRLRGSAGPIAIMVGLGLAFLALSPVDLFRVGFGPSDHAYGSVYFVLVGLAWVLAAAGVLFGALVLARVATSEQAYLPLLGVRSMVLYWGFVGLVWLGVFGTVYVVPYLGGGVGS
jgi:heme/copper-type cytochrome/quinol oxidase subunit 3